MSNIIIFCWPPCSGKTSSLSEYFDYQIVSSDDEIKKIDQNFSQNELNSLWVQNSLEKIQIFIQKWISNIIYDSTNLTVLRRKNIFLNIHTSFTAVNFIVDFNTLYNNWKKRGQDIEIENLFYLHCIFQKATKKEWFYSVINKRQSSSSDYPELLWFLKTWVLHLDLILKENKDLKFLYDFWKQGKKDFFEEYFQKLKYLDELSLNDKFALLYSDIKYFYHDFISTLHLTYMVSYDDFIDGFVENIWKNKIKKMWLNKQKVESSLKKLIKIF